MTIENIGEIGNRVKDLRIRAGLTQKALADGLNVSQNAISRMEDKGGGTVQFLLDVLRFFETRYDVSCFLQKGFSVDKAKVINVRPLDTVAAERLKMLQEEINHEINHLIGLFEQN